WPAGRARCTSASTGWRASNPTSRRSAPSGSAWSTTSTSKPCSGNSGHPMTVESVSPSQGTVLVVDDAPETLRWLCDVLEAEHYSVLVARSGEEAIERLEYVVPDAVLLDAVMPGLSGFETCRRIKANPAWSHVPVIFMT